MDLDFMKIADHIKDPNEALGFLKKEHFRLLEEYNQLVGNLRRANKALENYMHSVRGGISEALGILDAAADNIEDGNLQDAQRSIQNACGLLSQVFEYQKETDTIS